MRVLGVDPGLTRCGLGIVEGGLGQPLRMIAVGVVRTPQTDAPELRLLALQAEIDAWLAQHTPDAVAVERVFAKANIRGSWAPPRPPPSPCWPPRGSVCRWPCTPRPRSRRR